MIKIVNILSQKGWLLHNQRHSQFALAVGHNKKVKSSHNILISWATRSPGCQNGYFITILRSQSGQLHLSATRFSNITGYSRSQCVVVEGNNIWEITMVKINHLVSIWSQYQRRDGGSGCCDTAWQLPKQMTEKKHCGQRLRLLTYENPIWKKSYSRPQFVVVVK